MFRLRVLLTLICISLFVSPPAASFASDQSPPPPLGAVDFTGSGAGLQVLRGVPEYTSISLSSSSVVIENQTLGYETYQVFGIPGEPFIMDEGVPEVPMIARFYRIPDVGGVDLVLSNTEDFEVIEGVNVMPFQMEGSDHFGLARAAVMDQDQWFPPQLAEMSEPMMMRDFRVVRLVLYPVQVNPVTHQARLYHALQAELVANGEPSVNEIPYPHRITASWAPIYRDMIANLDENALLDLRNTPGTYMILTHSNSAAREWADSLALWKHRKGFEVVVDARTNWSASSMVTAIQNMYASSANTDSPLEFVCLIGDPDWPTYGMPSGGAYSDYDHNFAKGNNGDDIEDIGCGRLSGVGSSEMGSINARTLSYERNPQMENAQGQPDTMWFHRGFFYAGVGHEIASNWTLMQWGAQQFRDWTAVDCTYVYNHSGGVNGTLICNHLNLGVGFCLWRGSYAGEWDQSLPAGCSATWRLPLCFMVTCYANDFIGGDGSAEKMAKWGSATAPKGAVAAIGTATGGTTAPPNATIVGGLMHSMSTLGVEHYGHCLNNAKMWLVRLWGTSHNFTHDFTRWNNLMGDPGLSIWTDVPNVMNVSHAMTINVGTRQMVVDVTDDDNGSPIADALVVLWKGTETYVKGLTDINGHVQLPVTIDTPGTLMITVTKRNHKPYLYDAPCVTVGQYVSVSSFTVDDDNAGGTEGNDNHELNPGETIDLPVYLRNFGSSGLATNIHASLASSNPRVTVITDSSAFANLAPGDTALGTPPFRIEISPTMQHEEKVLLTFTVNASTVETRSAVEFECKAGEPTYTNHAFAGTVNPGTTNNLQVTLGNRGDLILSATTGTLTSLSPFVQVDDAQGTFGNIAPGGSATNTSDQFTLTSNTLTFRGHQAPMRLILSTSDGYVDTVQFIVSIGSATTTDPTGPDAYGYYAYDNTDVTYETAPVFNYLNISSGLGTNLGLNDPGEKILYSANYSTVRHLPFSFTYYGVTYDTITVCSNGWIAFGNQGWNDIARNYPLPGLVAPEGMVAPYWDDLKTQGSGLGVWDYNDSAEHRYVVQWKAQGAYNTTALDFEVILLEEFFYPTFDGNGQILVQYNDATMGITGNWEEPNGCTIGIQDWRCTTALQYAFLTNGSSPGAATITDGRAVLYTTNARMLFGAVEGTIRDAETNLALPGVDVTMDGYSYHVVTDAAGHYLVDDVLIGTYTLRAHKRAFNDTTEANVVVALDDTATVNLSMLHPEFTLSVDTLRVSIPEQPNTTHFDITNGGNGPLEYSTTIVYAGDLSTDPWDSLESIGVTEATGDYMIQGVEFAADHWYVSGSGAEGQPMLYRFDTHGNYGGSMPQPPTDGIGWFDLAYDGQYLYGSGQRMSGGGLIMSVDLDGLAHGTIPIPVNPARALAYDADSDHFWVADLTSDIYEVSRDGTIVTQVSNEGGNELNIRGLAWHETEADGYKLLLFCDNGSGTQLWKMHPVSHDRQLITTLAARPGDHAGGLTITPGWNSVMLVLGGILQGQGPAGDHLGIYEVTFNTTWIDVSPMQAMVPGNQTQEVTVTFDPTFLRTDTYRVNLRMWSAVLDSTYVLPVILDILSDAPDPRHPGLPTVYALYQNYPNPFNPSTEILFDLPQGGKVKLEIFNTLGQRVRTLADGVRAAGSYRAVWNGKSDGGADVAAGVYIYRLETASYVSSQKMVLLR